jgi:hypothetical protein
MQPPSTHDRTTLNTSGARPIRPCPRAVLQTCCRISATETLRCCCVAVGVASTLCYGCVVTALRASPRCLASLLHRTLHGFICTASSARLPLHGFLCTASSARLPLHGFLCTASFACCTLDLLAARFNCTLFASSAARGDRRNRRPTSLLRRRRLCVVCWLRCRLHV